ncbi:hypothetical protein CA235_07405 [Sphingomonas sp. ABOLF]|uniref:hypothetical protein n=1 Tax=Sphingomonas sp. ABOLF TaxID=1985879 RepID=UPI000F7E37C3|nr:hypothetical protein [Sphingomonas sp. ABOLF]RSV15671.1 hypothetical protein CA235_07405 [Sphingomonas sp. ABOLF]
MNYEDQGTAPDPYGAAFERVGRKASSQPRTIPLTHATVTYTPEGCYSTFRDDSSYGALPHDTPDYDEIARRCGYWEGWPGLGPLLRGQARLRYCREHEVCHHLVGEAFYNGPSPVLWALAHGSEVTLQEAALEEAMVMTLQRWLRANERPIIGGVEWSALKSRALALLD